MKYLEAQALRASMPPRPKMFQDRREPKEPAVEEVESAEAVEVEYTPSAKLAEIEEPNATPAAAGLAGELGIDLSSVKGTGAEGRITVADVRAAAE